MKWTTALCGVCVASLIAAAGCDDGDADDGTLRAQLGPGTDLDGGTRDAGDDDHDHEHDAGTMPVGMDAGDAPGDDADASAPADPACAELTYADFGEPFLEKYCVGCHLGARAVGGIDLSTLAGVKEHKDHVIAHAVDEDASEPMPPPSARQPTDAERARLGTWLACGPK
ncbi:MAG: hypothetical protein ABW252_07330 [Polyangiales bacterium]